MEGESSLPKEFKNESGGEEEEENGEQQEVINELHETTIPEFNATNSPSESQIQPSASDTKDVAESPVVKGGNNRFEEEEVMEDAPDEKGENAQRKEEEEEDNQQVPLVESSNNSVVKERKEKETEGDMVEAAEEKRDEKRTEQKDDQDTHHEGQNVQLQPSPSNAAKEKEHQNPTLEEDPIENKEKQIEEVKVKPATTAASPTTATKSETTKAAQMGVRIATTEARSGAHATNIMGTSKDVIPGASVSHKGMPFSSGATTKPTPTPRYQQPIGNVKRGHSPERGGRARNLGLSGDDDDEENNDALGATYASYNTGLNNNFEVIQRRKGLLASSSFTKLTLLQQQQHSEYNSSQCLSDHVQFPSPTELALGAATCQSGSFEVSGEGGPQQHFTSFNEAIWYSKPRPVPDFGYLTADTAKFPENRMATVRLKVALEMEAYKVRQQLGFAQLDDYQVYLHHGQTHPLLNNPQQTGEVNAADSSNIVIPQHPTERQQRQSPMRSPRGTGGAATARRVQDPIRRPATAAVSAHHLRQLNQALNAGKKKKQEFQLKTMPCEGQQPGGEIGNHQAAMLNAHLDDAGPLSTIDVTSIMHHQSGSQSTPRPPPYTSYPRPEVSSHQSPRSGGATQVANKTALAFQHILNKHKRLVSEQQNMLSTKQKSKNHHHHHHHHNYQKEAERKICCLVEEKRHPSPLTKRLVAVSSEVVACEFGNTPHHQVLRLIQQANGVPVSSLVTMNTPNHPAHHQNVYPQHTIGDGSSNTQYSPYYSLAQQQPTQQKNKNNNNSPPPIGSSALVLQKGYQGKAATNDPQELLQHEVSVAVHSGLVVPHRYHRHLCVPSRVPQPPPSTRRSTAMSNYERRKRLMTNPTPVDRPGSITAW